MEDVTPTNPVPEHQEEWVLPPPTRLAPDRPPPRAPPHTPSQAPPRDPPRDPMVVADRNPVTESSALEPFPGHQEKIILTYPETAQRYTKVNNGYQSVIGGYPLVEQEVRRNYLHLQTPRSPLSPVTPTNPPDSYSYTHYSQGRPLSHGEWRPRPGPTMRTKVFSRPRSRAREWPGQRRRWWQAHRRQFPGARRWPATGQRRQFLGTGQRNLPSSGYSAAHRQKQRYGHNLGKLTPLYGQRRVDHQEDTSQQGPTWGGWGGGGLAPELEHQGPGEARRGEPRFRGPPGYRGAIRVDGWSSSRVVDNILGVGYITWNHGSFTCCRP